MRLLWVENHTEFVTAAGRQFLSGHAVTVVPSLAAARRALADGSFDAVLLDHDLDDGPGTGLMDFIHGLSDRPAVIAASAHDAGNGALLRAGADAVCGKLQFAEIGTVLTRVAGNRGATSEGSSHN
jgi:DNA-binding response OmpR family regulator